MNEWTTDEPTFPGTLAALRMHANAAAPRAALATWMGDHWLTWSGFARGRIEASEVAMWCPVPLWPSQSGAA
jgi:hypothetical protein